MDGQGFVQDLQGYFQQGLDVALEWLGSPAAWSQFGLLLASYVAARVIAARGVPVVTRLLTPPADRTGPIARLRRFVLLFVPLAMPLMAWAFTLTGEALVRAAFGTGVVIAFGKNLFLFLAARAAVRDIVSDGFLRFLGRFVLLPILLLNLVGLLDPVSDYLNAATIDLGNIRFSAMALVRGLISGALLFWLGRWSNSQSEDFIKARDELRPATRELAIKASQIAIFGAAFLLLMSIMGIDLTAVAVLGGALGVGIGLGLQQIAANFVSGVILLLEGQTTVGDFVVLDNGEEGTIVKMTARAAILETVDGRWIVVPNEDFITSRVFNLSDAGKAHRYEAAFSVSYDTDINLVPDLIEAAVGALDFVLQGPGREVECELTAFADSGVEFSVEYWVEGIEDLTGKYRSVVLFAIWNALKGAEIEIPYPQRVVHHRGLPPTAMPEPAPHA
ncbi:MAG: mechanosensitive ion channel [Rhodobacter sp.]|uniref:mechanosensitive ion channel family protein n=1 Tax=Pararhodobacter sp. TaxID=2127056 RepID=UPI001DDA0336|nr:mechanosensitive ion channel domain-containing protein [Pararhodobacter sp.]MCB1346988.1 mechanosensitive ion channel [Paracoccaceae bacterium]MCC0073060.1 mechanosensitive ion channel [Rhodobacter sp.]HPD94013.1 mechanosensitive ion channel [Pararhodobacter sp.]